MPRVAKPRAVLPASRALPWMMLAIVTALSPAPARAAPQAGPAPAAGASDSILAVVTGRGQHEPARTIGRADFIRAWRQLAPPARPDSLTPAGARRFLDLLIDKAALDRMAARERWTWTARESTAFETLRDRLVVEAMLDSALAATRSELGPAGDTLDRGALGLAARERTMARLGPVYDDSLLARVALAFAAIKRPTSDSSLFVQLRMLGASPEVAPGDTGRVLARWPAGEYRVSDLLASWRRLNPVYRPRVTTPAEVRELAMNGIFERQLRREGEGRGLEQRPDVAARLANQRELNDVSHLVEREVYARIAADSLTLLRFYESTAKDWFVPTRVRLVRVEFQQRSDAAAMALRLADPVEAESLAVGAQRARLPWVVDLAATEDSALYARALAAGTGAVVGPDAVGNGWRVARVLAVLPGRHLPFADARAMVGQRWYGEEGERLMRDLVARARAASRVAIHPAALVALLQDPPAELSAPPPASGGSAR